MSVADRAYPETDTTRWVLRTKSAPLSETGTHEIVASSYYKSPPLMVLATSAYGRKWRETYEIKPRTSSRG